MRFLKAKFKNFVGFLTGLGLNEVEIDFEKQQHRMCLIIGRNGSGKSSLMEALTLFPDIYSSVREANGFIVKDKDGKRDGYRELWVSQGNDTYISACHWINEKTKCFLARVMPGGSTVELNENGNVGSYIELLEAIFGLTKEHNRLLFLGAGMKDIVSSPPSERKNSISKFVPNVEEYLETYKKSAKYHSKLKNDIGVVSSELHRLGGDKNNIIINRDSALKKRELAAEKLQRLKSLESTVVTTLNALNIGSESVSDVYEKHVRLNNELCAKLTKLNDSLKETCDAIPVENNLTTAGYSDIITESRDSLSKLEYQRDTFNTRYGEMTDSLQALRTLYENQNLRYSEFVKNNNPETFINEQRCLDVEIADIKESEKTFREEVPGLDSIADTLFSKEDSGKYLIFIDGLQNRIEQILSAYSGNSIISDYVSGNFSMDNKDTEAEKLDMEKNRLSSVISDLRSKISGYEQSKELQDLLLKIPENCDNKQCLFIQKAHALQDTSADRLYTELKNHEDDLASVNKRIDNLNEYFHEARSFIKEISNLTTYIDSFSDVINLFPDRELIHNIPELFRNKGFLKPRARKYSEYAYLKERDTEIRKRLVGIKDSIIKGATYYGTKKQLETELEKLEKQVFAAKSAIEQLNNSNENTGTEIQYLTRKISSLSLIVKTREEITGGLNKLLVIKRNIKRLDKKNREYHFFNSRLSLLRDKIKFSEQELSQYESELNTAEYNLRRFTEFEETKTRLTADFETLEVLRKCWSSTTGIPLIFIEGFMSNLLNDANRYLNELWSLETLQITGFDIDEKSFFINVDRGDMEIPYTDASQCSGAERAMICTVLSLALLKQLPNIGTSYNITKFDEIDYSLDYERKRIFLDILTSLLDDINAEQSFIVSHSDIFQGDCDVILLKGSEEYSERLFGQGSFNEIYRHV